MGKWVGKAYHCNARDEKTKRRHKYDVCLECVAVVYKRERKLPKEYSSILWPTAADVQKLLPLHGGAFDTQFTQFRSRYGMQYYNLFVDTLLNHRQWNELLEYWWQSFDEDLSGVVNATEFRRGILLVIHSAFQISYPSRDVLALGAPEIIANRIVDDYSRLDLDYFKSQFNKLFPYALSINGVLCRYLIHFRINNASNLTECVTADQWRQITVSIISEFISEMCMKAPRPPDLPVDRDKGEENENDENEGHEVSTYIYQLLVTIFNVAFLPFLLFAMYFGCCTQRINSLQEQHFDFMVSENEKKKEVGKCYRFWSACFVVFILFPLSLPLYYGTFVSLVTFHTQLERENVDTAIYISSNSTSNNSTNISSSNSEVIRVDFFVEAYVPFVLALTFVFMFLTFRVWAHDELSSNAWKRNRDFWVNWVLVNKKIFYFPEVKLAPEIINDIQNDLKPESRNDEDGKSTLGGTGGGSGVSLFFPNLFRKRTNEKEDNEDEKSKGSVHQSDVKAMDEEGGGGGAAAAAVAAGGGGGEDKQHLTSRVQATAPDVFAVPINVPSVPPSPSSATAPFPSPVVAPSVSRPSSRLKPLSRVSSRNDKQKVGGGDEKEISLVDSLTSSEKLDQLLKEEDQMKIEAIRSDQLLTSLAPSASVDIRSLHWSDVPISVSLALIHTFTPGIYRVATGNNFLGNNSGETLIVVVHVFFAPFLVLCLCGYLRCLIAIFDSQFRLLQKLQAFVNPTEAKKWNLVAYMDLTLTPENIEAWCLLRSFTVRKFVEKPVFRVFLAGLAPINVFAVTLMVTLFVRVVVLGLDRDFLNLMFAIDVIIVCSYLVVVVLYLIRCNDMTVEQLKLLEQAHFNIAGEIILLERAVKYKKLKEELLMEKQQTRSMLTGENSSGDSPSLHAESTQDGPTSGHKRPEGNFHHSPLLLPPRNAPSSTGSQMGTIFISGGNNPVHSLSQYDEQEQRRLELTTVNYVLEAAISRVRNLPEPVKVFGVVVDNQIYFQLFSLLCASALSSIAKLANFF